MGKEFAADGKDWSAESTGIHRAGLDAGGAGDAQAPVGDSAVFQRDRACGADRCAGAALNTG